MVTMVWPLTCWTAVAVPVMLVVTGMLAPEASAAVTLRV